MASFIISIRGTVAQAVLLGLSAAFSHTLIIWVLAATLVAVGSAAALSVREASRRFAGFAVFAHRLPYASVGLIGVVGLVLAVLGLKHLSH